MREYDSKAIEKKWQETWEQSRMFATSDAVEGKENYLTMVEFPYPSGNLHVGHWYAFSVPDIYARYQRMNGKNVLFPIGFDAFGLPAENAAIKRGLNPREWTLSNIEYMRSQLKTMGSSFDWSREVVTCDPSYYRWTQWLFLKFFEKGLAYQKETPANWCPSCKTVLANEQVIAGHCDRCDSIVEKRLMKQWNLKITDYAERLLNDLDTLSWPEPIKEAQRNWIGKSEGAEIDFPLVFSKHPEDNERRGPNGEKAHLTVFTTRPDTLYGATYLAIAPEHLWIRLALNDSHDVLSNKDEVQKYVDTSNAKSEIERMAEGREKTGVRLEGVMAINPATHEEIPIYVADYVLGSYGTGAVMAVPAHDERDWEFAKTFGLPSKYVVEPTFVGESGDGAVRAGLPFIRREAVCAIVRNPKDNTYLCNSWKSFKMHGLFTGGVEEGEDVVEGARREVQEETGYKNLRYISTSPIAINTFFYHRVKQQNRHAHFQFIFFELENEERDQIDEKEAALHEVVWKTRKELDGFFTVFEGQFLLNLLDNAEYVYTGEGLMISSGEFTGMKSIEAQKQITESVGGRWVSKYKLRDWGISRQRYWGCPIPVIHCSLCGAVAVPETELPVVLPEISDYLPTGEGKSPLGKATEWMHVSCPECGGEAERETDTLDTFIDSSWYYLRYSDPHNTDVFSSQEKQKQWMPVDFYSGGAEHTTMHLLYSRFFNKALFDLGLVGENEPFVRRMNRGLILGPDGNKMSKSKGNVIDPDEIVRLLGADTVRVYLAFIGPYNEVGAYPWNPDGVVGARRFIERVWNLHDRIDEGPLSATLDVALHQTIKKVSESIDTFKFNTGVSGLMTLLNLMEKEASVSREGYEMLLRLLAPFAPHVSEELWEQLGHTISIHLEGWPVFDPAKLTSGEVTIAIQVNGKVRGVISCPQGTSEATVLALARADEKAAPWIEKGPISKVIYIPDKVLNIVLKGD